MPSDSMVIAAGEMPGELVRTAEVQVMRVDPERWVAPHPGQPVRRARDHERGLALYEDTMDAQARDRHRPRRRAGPPRPRLPRRHQGRARLDLRHQRRRHQDQHRPRPDPAAARPRRHAAAGAGAAVQRQGRGPAVHRPPQPRPTRAAADRDDLDDRWGRLGLDGRRGLPRRRVLGAAARRRPPHAQQRVAPRGRARSSGGRRTVRRCEGLLRFCFSDASDMRNQLSFVEERCAASCCAGRCRCTTTPARVGLLDGPADGAPAKRPPEPGRRAVAGPFHDLDGPGGVAGRRAGRRGRRRRRLDRPRRPRAR